MCSYYKKVRLPILLEITGLTLLFPVRLSLDLHSRQPELAKQTYNPEILQIKYKFDIPA